MGRHTLFELHKKHMLELFYALLPTLDTLRIIGSEFYIMRLMLLMKVATDLPMVPDEPTLKVLRLMVGVCGQYDTLLTATHKDAREIVSYCIFVLRRLPPFARAILLPCLFRVCRIQPMVYRPITALEGAPWAQWLRDNKAPQFVKSQFRLIALCLKRRRLTRDNVSMDIMFMHVLEPYLNVDMTIRTPPVTKTPASLRLKSDNELLLDGHPPFG